MAGRPHAFGERDLPATDYVWADGIHLRIRLEEAMAAALVVMGMRADGTKELIAMADGYRTAARPVRIQGEETRQPRPHQDRRTASRP